MLIGDTRWPGDPPTDQPMRSMTLYMASLSVLSASLCFGDVSVLLLTNLVSNTFDFGQRVLVEFFQSGAQIIETGFALRREH